MPANEQTWRDTKLMHKIFGVSSALMLIATIWMFAADHNREWKPIQRAANHVEMTLTDWRKFQFQSDEFVKRHQELVEQLTAAERRHVERGLLDAFEAEVRTNSNTKDYSFERIRATADQLLAHEGEPEAEPLREELIESLRRIVRLARFREDKVLSDRKFKSADRDAAVAQLGLLVRDSDNLPPDEAQRLQADQQREVDRLTRELAGLTRQYEEAKEHRTKLDNIVKQITRDEDQASETLAKNEADLMQLRDTNVQRRSTYVVWYGWLPLPGKRLLELPILDAFNSPRKIDNYWSTGLDIDYKHARVRRYDRCTTCHQMIEKTAAGSAVEPAYEQESYVDFLMVPPEGATALAEAALKDRETPPVPAGEHYLEVPKMNSFEAQLERVLGLLVASEGLVVLHDATVQYVRPHSPSATARAIRDPSRVSDELSGASHERPGLPLRKSLLTADPDIPEAATPPGLLAGDVIVAINGDPVMHSSKAASGLMDAALAGRPFVLSIRRGMPNPFSSHPRLDLYAGSLSPHKAGEFACTICHDGQGSGTAFQWAAHTPNSVRQRKDWAAQHGWFDNPHWSYPMSARRFLEGTCLKCHHQVTELEPSERFPDPPAPKLVRGYHLIRKYGCYGCHEINGYDGPRSIGPDLRLEPNYFAAALQLKQDPGYAQLTEPQRDWIQQMIDHPDRDHVRHRLLDALQQDAQAESPRLSRESHEKIVPLLRDVELPGKLRKAGPSLRFVGHKLDASFLYDWIREPKHFRPSTRMPQFFGLNKHLQDSPGLEEARQFEPLEILGIATYLQQRTQPFEYLEPPAGVTEAADRERGRTQFETRGCLACHTHRGFPATEDYRAAEEIVQGPDLSGVGDKFVGEKGRKWLYSWIKAPSRYHARTVMPDLFLEPMTVGEGKVSDPVADIVEFLLSESKTGWQPAEGTLTSPAAANTEHLQRLVVENLAETFSHSRATAYAEKGIPESLRGELKGAEVELLVADNSQAALSPEQKLMYLGRKSFGKYGCYGCHDVPGFEDSKPIGTTLADWGRKDTARLAFEHITHYLDHGHGTGHGGHGPAPHAPAEKVKSPAGEARPATAGEQPAAGDARPAEDAGAPGHVVPPDYASGEDREYYLEQIKAGHRVGFLYQKLLEPRSFDYHKTENKKYNERLRMPQFPFDPAEREAIMTFVLGLVADPPAAKYIYRPKPLTAAVLAGREVLEKYNCGGCHILSPEKWRIAFPPDQFGEQPASKTFPFVHAYLAPDTLAASTATDRAGLARASVAGVPVVDDNGIPLAFDDAGDPLDDGTADSPARLELPFELWQSAPINGHAYQVGVLPLSVLSSQIERRYASDGGFLTRYLLQRVVALEKQSNPQAKGAEAWGWLPPPLSGEGSKVQSDWLHSFLLNPYPIRPATFLRMPRFNMSPAEATALVNYFAAVDDAEFPYAYQAPPHLAQKESQYRTTLTSMAQQPAAAPAPVQPAAAEAAQPVQVPQVRSEDRSRLTDAMRIVVNNNYCVKCHRVGDFEPAGTDRAKAPNLADVYRRLRPEYVRQWIANPKSILPYASMPVNVPFDPDLPNLGGVSQELYHGTSVEQVDGLVDLLMNYDEFAKRRSSVVELVKQHGGPPVAPTTAPPPTTPATPPAATGDTATGGGGR
jgi:cytochrome c2